MALNTSDERIQHTVHSDLDMEKNWILKCLNVDQKREKVEADLICARFGKNADLFTRVVTMDET